MISKTSGFRGLAYFQTHPYGDFRRFFVAFWGPNNDDWRVRRSPRRLSTGGTRWLGFSRQDDLGCPGTSCEDVWYRWSYKLNFYSLLNIDLEYILRKTWETRTALLNPVLMMVDDTYFFSQPTKSQRDTARKTSPEIWKQHIGRQCSCWNWFHFFWDGLMNFLVERQRVIMVNIIYSY